MIIKIISLILGWEVLKSCLTQWLEKTDTPKTEKKIITGKQTYTTPSNGNKTNISINHGNRY